MRFNIPVGSPVIETYGARSSAVVTLKAQSRMGEEDNNKDKTEGY